MPATNSCFARAAVALALVQLAAPASAADAAAANGSSCTADSAAACKCLLACKVFGGNATACDSAADKNEVLDKHVYTAQMGLECEEITCVVGCAAKLGCLDAHIINRCTAVKQQKNKAKAGSCPVDCANGSPRAVVGVLASSLAVGMSLLY